MCERLDWQEWFSR